MGKVFSAVTSLFGGGYPKASAAPLSVAAPVAEVQDQATQSKKSRAALYATEGGAAGEELNPDQVKKRPTLLGN